MFGRTTKHQMPELEVTVHALRCLECGELSEGDARGWKALLGGGFEGEPTEVGTFCPACAEREFGL